MDDQERHLRTVMQGRLDDLDRSRSQVAGELAHIDQQRAALTASLAELDGAGHDDPETRTPQEKR